MGLHPARWRLAMAMTMAAVAACSFTPTGLPGEVDDGGAQGDAEPSDGPPVDGLPVDGLPVDGLPVDGAPIDGPPTDAALMFCPAGYVGVIGSLTMYRVVDAPVTWAAGAADCADDAAMAGALGQTHLAVITNEIERNALLVAGISGNRWVGLTDEVAEGTFVWITDEPAFGYPALGSRPPWDNGEPNGGGSDDCVRVKNAWTFEDKDCGDTNKVLCECDAFPAR